MQGEQAVSTTTSTYERIREKRAVRRKRFFKKLMLIIFTIASFIGVYFLLHQPWLAFGNVYVSGTKSLLREEILFLANIQEPVNLFLLKSKDIEETLKKDLRIKNVQTGYQLPNVFYINIEEEQPLFYVKSNYGFISVNSKAKVFSAAKSIKNSLAPIVTGISSEKSYIGDTITDKMLLQIYEFLNTLGEVTKNKISEINIYDNTKVKIIDVAGRPYFLGEIKGLNDKIQQFSGIINEFSQKNVDVEFIDLSYSKPYIKIRK